MSHTNISYPQSTRHNLSLCHHWQVHEDGDDYNTDSEGRENPAEKLLELTDHITERLTRAEALAWILQSAEQPPEHALKVTAMLIQDLIQEAREANEEVWELVRRLTRKDN